jgi:hypothetical protein
VRDAEETGKRKREKEKGERRGGDRWEKPRERKEGDERQQIDR